MVPLTAQESTSPQTDVFFDRGARATTQRVNLDRLRSYVDLRTLEFGLIEPQRKQELQELSGYVSAMKATGKPVKLTFICYANSRRSQLAEVWAATAAAHYGIDNLEVYSGGAGVSAFNKRISRTLSGAGFDVIMRPGHNTQVLVRYSDREPPIVCSSKTFQDPQLPKEDYIAIMLCEDADEACPVMPGATYRVLIPYVDPRLADHSEEEREIYTERNAQIAREMFYMMSLVR